MNNGKNLSDYPDLPNPIEVSEYDMSNHLITQELAYDKEFLARQSKSLLQMLNVSQMEAYEAIMHSIENKENGFFFIYGSGGTGKSFFQDIYVHTS